MLAGRPDRDPGAPFLTGAILAGGFSRRLGQDKAALQLGGKPLILWVHEALASTRVSGTQRGQREKCGPIAISHDRSPDCGFQQSGAAH